MKYTEENLVEFIQSTECSDFIKETITNIWLDFKKLNPPILPMVWKRENGGLVIAWSSLKAYAEIEIRDDGWEWFYRNRDSEAIEGNEEIIDHPFEMSQTIKEAFVETFKTFY